MALADAYCVFTKHCTPEILWSPGSLLASPVYSRGPVTQAGLAGYGSSLREQEAEQSYESHSQRS